MCHDKFDFLLGRRGNFYNFVAQTVMQRPGRGSSGGMQTFLKAFIRADS